MLKPRGRPGRERPGARNISGRGMSARADRMVQAGNPNAGKAYRGSPDRAARMGRA